MDFYDQHLLSELNKNIKPYGYKFKVKHEEDALSLKFFNGKDWEDYAGGYYSDEMQELLFSTHLSSYSSASSATSKTTTKQLRLWHTN